MDEGKGQTWLTPQEVADEIRVNYITVLRWIKSGDLRAYKLGTQYRVSRAELNQWIEARAHSSVTDTDDVEGAAALVTA